MSTSASRNRQPLRHEEVGAGGSIEVRLATPQDADAIAALYASLSDEDVRLRFFAPYHPDRRFFERWTSLAERGGNGLVVLFRTDAQASPELVAEAGYAPLANGNAELAMTIAAGWRGWLGPYLLDALLEQAARDGFANLEAEVLSSNAAMLALLRARGAAVSGHDRWTSIRLVVATAGRTPSWPPADDRPRVLVEGTGTRWAGEEPAEGAGIDVITCPGPGRRRHGCPLLEGRSCPLVDGADAVVVVVRDGDDLGPRLLSCLAEQQVATPVYIECSRRGGPPTARPEHTEQFDGTGRTPAVISALREQLMAGGAERTGEGTADTAR